MSDELNINYTYLPIYPPFQGVAKEIEKAKKRKEKENEKDSNSDWI